MDLRILRRRKNNKKQERKRPPRYRFRIKVHNHRMVLGAEKLEDCPKKDDPPLQVRKKSKGTSMKKKRQQERARTPKRERHRR